MTPTLPSTDLLPPPAAHGVRAPPAPEPELDDDGLPPFSENLLARLRERDWLDGEYDAGRLIPYQDEYVIAANRTILAHNWNVNLAYAAAQRKADELGIPHGILTNYFDACS